MRHSALPVIAGLTFAVMHAAAVADSEHPRSESPADVAIVFEQLADHGAAAPPPLSRDERDRLLAGEPVIKEPAETGDSDGDEVGELGIFGLQVVQAPRLLVWLTVMGAASEPHIRLTRAYLARLPQGAYVRYQHINLPWPVRNRHWVILCAKNLELATVSDGVIWEHRWELHDNGMQMLRDAYAESRIKGLPQEELGKAVYLPANRGAWTLADLGGGRTLVIGYFDAEFGGLLPKILVRGFARRQMHSGLKLIQELTEHVHLEYDGEPQIHDGFGQPIRPQDVLQLARQRDASPTPDTTELPQ